MEVIAAVKRASGGDFAVRFGPPRVGDPAALVAEAHRIGEVLGWRPRHDDLDGIVADTLGWESGAWSNTAPPLNITA
jgi:UDP-glucose 4-epimerase